MYIADALSRFQARNKTAQSAIDDDEIYAHIRKCVLIAACLRYETIADKGSTGRGSC